MGGPTDRLLIAACYMSKKARWVAGFNTQKVLQIPEGFGTGCIVQSVARPEMFNPPRGCSEAMNYSGVAEVEI